jgi:hypothetical protein
MTGSAFGHNSVWPEQAVRLTGETHQWTRVGESGGKAYFDFCPTCGSTVTYRIDARPDMVSIPIGAFADPEFPEPHAEVYAEKAHRWLGKLLDEAVQE